MPVSLQIIPHPTYLHATLTGEITPPSAKQALAQILDAAWDNRQPHILIDLRTASGVQNLTVVDRFDLVTYLVDLVREARSKGLLDVRVAQVAREYRADVDTFSQTVAANRGLALRITADLDEALAWLGVNGNG